MMDRTASLINKLENITDPRPGEPVYPLVNVLFMTICAVIAGADDYVSIAKFANTKMDRFAKFLDMSAGVPSHDRFNAIVNKTKPEEFEPMLLAWLRELHKITDGQVISIRRQSSDDDVRACRSGAVHVRRQ